MPRSKPRISTGEPVAESPAQEEQQISPAAGRRARRKRHTAGDIADAVFEQQDPVVVASALLKKGSDAVKARTLENLLEYKYGRPPAGDPANTENVRPVNIQVITNIPRPKRRKKRKAGAKRR